VADVARMILQVLPAADSDEEELADLAGELHTELLGVDEVSVVPLIAEAAPEERIIDPWIARHGPGG
jgi:hypothetical protein